MKDIIIKVSQATRMVDVIKGTIGNDGENLQGNIIFEFKDGFVDGIGRLEYRIEGIDYYVMLEKIEETYQVPIKSVMTKYGQIDMQLVVTENGEDIPVFKSNVFFVYCNKSINAEIEQPNEYLSWIEVANSKLNEIDSAVEETNKQSAYAKQQGDYAKIEGDNAKSVAEETEKKAEEGKFNGKSLEFVWQGTKLGVRLEGQEAYQFVDLQGVQGEIGATGEPFKIKKTYASVSEMNADFRNMTFGDYVMIASSVEVEDNAKLYTRGESAWIFISDFSGAMGIRGETGLTPNIQIGEVKTLEAGSQAKVTRSGSNEEPVFNFELPKGDKGDNYVLTEEDKVEIGEKVNTEYEERITENEKYISDLEATIDILTNTNKAKGELVHITDALPLPTFENKIDGNVKQETTEGYNLIGLPDVEETTIRGLTFSIKNGLLKLNGTATVLVPLGNVLFNNLKETNKYRLQIFPQSGTWDNGWIGARGYIDGTQKWYQQIAKTDNTNYVVKTLTVEEFENNNRCDMYVANGSSFNNFSCYVLFKKGEEYANYEPYTGGQASPNPKYPQEIEVLEGYNEFNELGVTQGYGLNGTGVTYENTQWNVLEDYIEVLPNIDCVFSCDTDEVQRHIVEYDESKNFIKRTSTTGTGLFTTTNTTKYVRCAYRNDMGGNKYQFTKGSYFKPYLPYGHIGYKLNGKNFLDTIDIFAYQEKQSTLNNGTVTVDNGIITIDGTNATDVMAIRSNSVLTNNGLILPSGTYYLNDIMLNTRTLYNSSNKQYFGETMTLTEPVIVTQWFATCEKGSKKTIKPMISLEGGEYEPYKEQITYLDLKGNWVGAINDNIKDYLVTDKKKYWLVKNVGKVNKQFTNVRYVASTNSIYITDEEFRKFKSNTPLLCNIMTYKSWVNYIYGDVLHLDVSGLTETEINNYIDIIKSTNLEAYSQLAEPETIELGELPEPIKTFEGTNNIQLLANLDTEIEVKYALDVKKYYDNKLAEISAQII